MRSLFLFFSILSEKSVLSLYKVGTYLNQHHKVSVDFKTQQKKDPRNTYKTQRNCLPLHRSRLEDSSLYRIMIVFGEGGSCPPDNLHCRAEMQISRRTMVFSRPKRSVAWLLERSEMLAAGLSPVFFLPMAWLFSRLIRVKNVEVKDGGAGTWPAPPLRMCVFGSGLSSAVSY